MANLTVLCGATVLFVAASAQSASASVPATPVTALDSPSAMVDIARNGADDRGEASGYHARTLDGMIRLARKSATDPAGHDAVEDTTGHDAADDDTAHGTTGTGTGSKGAGTGGAGTGGAGTGATGRGGHESGDDHGSSGQGNGGGHGDGSGHGRQGGRG